MATGLSSRILAICVGGFTLFAFALCNAQLPKAIPPIDDAEPAIRHPAEVQVPTRVEIVREYDSLSVSYDITTLQNVKITVGKNMAVGVKDEFLIYVQGEPRPGQYRSRRQGTLIETNPAVPLTNLNFLQSTETLTTRREGIPAKGKQYIVERDFIVFETDIPMQHMWSPSSSKKYKVLLEKKLTGKG